MLCAAVSCEGIFECAHFGAEHKLRALDRTKNRAIDFVFNAPVLLLQIDKRDDG